MPAGYYSPGELAALLSKAGLGEIDSTWLSKDIHEGAPANHGRLHPFHYAAWLNKRGQDAGSPEAQAG